MVFVAQHVAWIALIVPFDIGENIDVPTRRRPVKCNLLHFRIAYF